MKCQDPARLTAAERFAQIAATLARGYVRLCLPGEQSRFVGPISQDCLDVIGRVEAPCGSPIPNPKSTSKE
jgi:hypothetical protein